MKQHVLIALIFVIGCATGGVASKLVVPPARADTNPTRWEYHCVDMNDLEATKLNPLGAEGWEMVSVAVHPRNFFTSCFKRAAP
jgi:hypothetical protein